MLELHVWAPAFGLPSIDAQCLAAITFFTQAVPKDQWLVIASHNASLSPTNELPALRDGEKWVGGYTDIVEYIHEASNGQWSLDEGLTATQRADLTAFSSFLEAQAQSLIDLSLYVSTDNFVNVVRPLYSQSLPFPLAYTIPPAIRAAAKERTEHLGLSSLDVDTEEIEDQNKSIIPESLRKPKITVTSLLQNTPENASRIRLDALATDVFEPLSQLKDEKRYLITQDEPTSLDCLAFGYLALALTPELPQQWLSSTLQKKFPQLAGLVKDLRDISFKNDVSIEDAFAAEPQTQQKTSLPWKQQDQQVAAVFGSTLLEHIPIVGRIRRSALARVEVKPVTEALEVPFWRQRSVAVTLGSLALGSVAALGLAVWQGFLTIPSSASRNPKKKGLAAYGEAGEALSVFSDQYDLYTQRAGQIPQI